MVGFNEHNARLFFGAVVVDCFEVFIKRPSGLLARAATWSSYKHHNTVKFLTGITPQGVVSSISQAYEGRVSDKYILQSTVVYWTIFYRAILFWQIMVLISQSLLGCSAYTSIYKRKDKLSPLEVEESQTIANVRIHVERVIGNVRKKYAILKGILPINFFPLLTE